MKKYSKIELEKIRTGKQDAILVDLGCGFRRKEGYIGVDKVQLAEVDIVCNLEEGFPFEDNVIDGIWSNFLFEHIADTIFLFQELYRVCRSGSIIEFSVPYYQSFTQFKDPTHKSIILPEMLAYFGQDNWYGADYGINVNFKVLTIKYGYLPPFNKFLSKKIFFLWPISILVLKFARRFLWNVVHSITIKLEVIK